jgi:hypothetical protein
MTSILKEILEYIIATIAIGVLGLVTIIYEVIDAIKSITKRFLRKLKQILFA